MSDNTVLLDFDAIFNAYMAKNQKVWAHDRTQSLGASEVFQCIRKGFFAKRGKELGYEPDTEDQSWGALERGNIIENHFVVPAVRSSMPVGLSVLYTGDDQVTLVADRNSATPDGLIVGLPKGCAVRVKAGSQDVTIPNIKSDCIVFEVKSIDPRANLIYEKAVHHGQTQMQIGLFHEKTEYRPYYSIILYVDASFVDKLTPFVVEFEEEKFAIGKMRAHGVWEHDDPMMFMPEGKFDGGCEHCLWKTACGEATLTSMPAKDTVTTDPEVVSNISPEVQEYLDLQDELKDVTAKFERAKEQVKEALTENKVRKAVGDDWSVVWSTVKGRTTLDTAAMDRDGINLAKYEKTGSGYDKLLITRTVDKKARKAAREAKKQ